MKRPMSIHLDPVGQKIGFGGFVVLPGGYFVLLIGIQDKLGKIAPPRVPDNQGKSGDRLKLLEIFVLQQKFGSSFRVFKIN